MAETDPLLPCRCCGCLTMGEYDGYFICPVCFWEDDPYQADNPDYAGGANRTSLLQARWNYNQFGACEQSMIKHVRPPTDDELPS